MRFIAVLIALALFAAGAWIIQNAPSGAVALIGLLVCGAGWLLAIAALFVLGARE